MQKIFIIITLLISTAFLSGCGGSTSSGGSQGTTVTMQADIKNGSSPIAFVGFSSGKIQSRAGIDFVLKSTINPNSGLMASDIGLVSQDISFEYIGCSDPTYKTIVQLPSFKLYDSALLTAGGTLTLTGFSVFLPVTAQYLADNYINVGGKNPFLNPNELQFKVNVNFNGVELKNQSNINVLGHANLFISNF